MLTSCQLQPNTGLAADIASRATHLPAAVRAAAAARAWRVVAAVEAAKAGPYIRYQLNLSIFEVFSRSMSKREWYKGQTARPKVPAANSPVALCLGCGQQRRRWRCLLHRRRRARPGRRRGDAGRGARRGCTRRRRDGVRGGAWPLVPLSAQLPAVCP